MKFEKFKEKSVWILITVGFLIAVISALENHWDWLANLCGSFGSGCREVRPFSFLTFPIAYWGIAFYLILGLINRFSKAWMFWVIMVAMGIEITFLWIIYSLEIPCLFCLLNAIVVLLLFICFFNKQMIWQSIAICLISFLFFNYALTKENQKVVTSAERKKGNISKNFQENKSTEIKKEKTSPTQKTPSKDTPAKSSNSQISIDINNSPTSGPEDAAVTIIEFSDYMCPACRNLHPVTSKIRQEYQDRVKWVFKDFPLRQHKGAERLAEAARCAWEQNKFWEFQDELFMAEPSIVFNLLPTIAQTLKMNFQQFKQCVDTRKYMFDVIKDRQDALNANINSTPTLLINGRNFPKAKSEEEFRKIIEEELEK
jgi:protein-disulfide isomerase